MLYLCLKYDALWSGDHALFGFELDEKLASRIIPNVNTRIKHPIDKFNLYGYYIPNNQLKTVKYNLYALSIPYIIFYRYQLDNYLFELPEKESEYELPNIIKPLDNTISTRHEIIQKSVKNRVKRDCVIL